MKNVDLWHRIYELAHWSPFLALVTDNENFRQITVRLVEAAIIGGIVMYGTVAVLKNDIDWIKKSISDSERRIERLEQSKVQLKNDIP